MPIFRMIKLRFEEVNNHLVKKLAYLQIFDHLPFPLYGGKNMEKYVG